MDRLVGLGDGLMARTKPSLAEALSPWSAPHDAADLLEASGSPSLRWPRNSTLGFLIRRAC